MAITNKEILHFAVLSQGSNNPRSADDIRKLIEAMESSGRDEQFIRDSLTQTVGSGSTPSGPSVNDAKLATDALAAAGIKPTSALVQRLVDRVASARSEGFSDAQLPDELLSDLAALVGSRDGAPVPGVEDAGDPNATPGFDDGSGGVVETSRLVQGLMETFGMSEANAQQAAVDDPIGSAESLRKAGAPGFGTVGTGAGRAAPNQQFQTDKNGNLVALNPATGQMETVPGGEGFGFAGIDPEREFAQSQGSLDEQARSNLATEMENIAVRAQRGELTTAQMENEFNIATSKIANEFGISAATLQENATQFRAQLQENGVINRASLGVQQRGQDIQANIAEFQTRSNTAVALGNQSLDEAEQIRRTLSGPSDYLARAFQTRGGESPLDFVSQADQINEFRANIDAFRAQIPGGIDIPEQEVIAAYKEAGGFVPPEFASPGGFVAPDISGAIAAAQPAPVAAPATPAPAPAPAPAADAPTLPAWVTDRLNDPAFDANSPDGAAAAAAAGGFYTNGPVAQPDTPSLEMAGETPVQQEPGAGLKQPLTPEMGFAEGGFTTAKKFIVGDDPETGLNATSEVVENPEGAKLKIHKGAKARGLPMFATGTGGEFDGRKANGAGAVNPGLQYPLQAVGGAGGAPGFTGAGSLFNNRGPVSQGQIAQQAKDFSPPAVSDVLAGKSPDAMRLGFRLPSMAAFGKLTADEKQSLGTRIGATHNASLGDLQFAQQQRFGRPGGAGQRARVGFGF